MENIYRLPLGGISLLAPASDGILSLKTLLADVLSRAHLVPLIVPN